MIEKILKWLNDKVGDYAGTFGFNTEWCALFVNRMLTVHGYTKMKGAEIYSCTAQMLHFKNMNIWHNSYPTKNEPCILYYDWDLSGDCDHVGIMIDKTDTGYITIEGNTVGDKWNNTTVNKMNRTIHNTARLIRGHVYLKDIFTDSTSTPPCMTPQYVYYGKNYVSQDNMGKCTLIQHMLNVVNNAGLTEDGILGDNTDIAIKEFQTKYNLEIDGVVGDETLFKLTQLYFNIPLDNFKF